MQKLRAKSHLELYPWKPQGQQHLMIQLPVEEQMTMLAFESRRAPNGAASCRMGQQLLTVLHEREEARSGSEHEAEKGRTQAVEPYEWVAAELRERAVVELRPPAAGAAPRPEKDAHTA
jgi:hypothetical protein